MSNDRYKSVEHRMIVSVSRNRVSVPIFWNPASNAVFGPLKQVLENGEKPLYKQRDQVLEYMKWAKPIISKLLEVLLERLKVKQIDELIKSVVMGTLILNLIHYPVCPSPELTAGGSRHVDVSSITMLLQDDVGGLYVREAKGDGWIHVPPVKGALVINIGDVL
ncbi:hypothetical protein P3S67_014348 [Capsicum chacoense]